MRFVEPLDLSVAGFGVVPVAVVPLLVAGVDELAVDVVPTVVAVVAPVGVLSDSGVMFDLQVSKGSVRLPFSSVETYGCP